MRNPKKELERSIIEAARRKSRIHVAPDHKTNQIFCRSPCHGTCLDAVAVTQHFVIAMPHTTSDDDNDLQHIQVKELHPTFGAEVHGVDFSKPVPEDVFSEIYKTITKVSIVYCFLFFNVVR